MTPTLSILITHHAPENRKYLDLCLKSIFYQNYKNIEVIVATSYPLENLDKRVSITINMPNTSYGEKINYAAKAASGSHLLIGQDDLIFTKLSIQRLMTMLGSQRAIIGPLSNSELDWRYNVGFDVMLRGAYMRLGKPMKIEQFEGMEDLIFDYQPTNFQMAIIVEWLAMYCVIMPKSVFQELGGYDLEYKNGFEDADFCFRAKKIGVNCFISIDSFVLHFGGATTASMNLEQSGNKKRFIEKHGKEPT